MPRRPRLARATAALTLALASISLFALAAPAAGARTISGTVPLRGMNVALLAANPGAARPVVLGTARSGAGGAFSLSYRGAGLTTVKYLLATRPGGGAEAGFPVPGSSYRLAAALGTGQVPARATVNERTTVAIGYAMAQFIAGGRVAGPNPGLRNAAAMSANLVARRSGGLSPVLKAYPNGNATSALATFDSLANLLATCRMQDDACATVLKLASAPGGGAAPDTLTAATNLARYPWHNAGPLFAASLRARALYAPALAAGEKPDAWTLALRFEGSPRGLDGPGNFAIDGGGNLWVGNNYAYSRQSRQPACASEELFRFTPTGKYFPGSPFTGGGLSGVGFGITIDPSNHVWAGNFGFAGAGCEKQPPHNSVSEFDLDGTALSPDLVESPAGSGQYRGGWEDGEVSWPQGTVSDRLGNIWIANCGNNSVTVYPHGDHSAAVNYPQSYLQGESKDPQQRFVFSRPFGAAVGAGGNVWVVGNDSATVVRLGPKGEVLSRVKGGGLHRPLGIASDSKGNVWVGNSTWVVAPCVGEFHPQSGPGKGGSVTLIKSNGQVAAGNPFSGGGILNAWGVAVDGDDNVWVANFTGSRLSELCGTSPRNCPAGKRRTGASISPAKSGYGFDGLVRNTGVAVDPSGNVWLANNWKTKPIQSNPGGYQIVAYLGLATPVKTPLLGPPRTP